MRKPAKAKQPTKAEMAAELDALRQERATLAQAHRDIAAAAALARQREERVREAEELERQRDLAAKRWGGFPITLVNSRRKASDARFDARKYDRVVFDAHDSDAQTGFRVESGGFEQHRGWHGDPDRAWREPTDAGGPHRWRIHIGRDLIIVTTYPDAEPTFHVVQR